VVKGGYEIRVARSRAFCPFSQIDVARTADPAVHVGRVYAFRIVEYKDDGRNLVVSRRALLEEEQQAAAAEVRRSVVPGAVLKGRVASVRLFGAFVDLGGGVQGLLHVSEMGWSRVADPSVLLSPGDEITVKVIRVDEDTQKIALSAKQLAEDPWASVQATYEVGHVHAGRVTRVAEFGAFVELAPGVEGLAHMSTFAPSGRPSDWTRHVPIGLTADFQILSIDVDKRRIGVALVQELERTPITTSAPTKTRIVPGARVTGKIERHEKFGVFVFLAPGVTGLMPLSESGVSREGDVAKALPVGSELEVIVLETDPAGRRIRLSRKAVLDAQEAEELREYHVRADAAPSGGLASLADKLRGALGSRPK
jgi:small subunit ribosomal protein S1